MNGPNTRRDFLSRLLSLPALAPLAGLCGMRRDPVVRGRDFFYGSNREELALLLAADRVEFERCRFIHAGVLATRPGQVIVLRDCVLQRTAIDSRAGGALDATYTVFVFRDEDPESHLRNSRFDHCTFLYDPKPPPISAWSHAGREPWTFCVSNAITQPHRYASPGT